MTLWTAVLTKWSSFGVDRPNLYAHDAAAHSTGPEVETLLKSRAQYIQLQQVDLRHTHLFWAATTTWAGSLLSVGIAKAQAAYVAPRKAHPGGATLSMPEQTLSELLRLMQTTLGWVAGCAWTDVATDLWPPTYWDPDPDAHGWKVLLLNALWATVLTACAAAYLVLTQTSASEVWGAETTDRDDVERSFITGAFSFFVGWQWVIVLRDVTVSVYRTEWSNQYVYLGERPDIPVLGGTVMLATIVFFAVKHRLLTGVWCGDAKSRKVGRNPAEVDGTIAA